MVLTNFPASVNQNQVYRCGTFLMECRPHMLHAYSFWLMMLMDVDGHKAPHGEPGPPSPLCLFSGIFGGCKDYLNRTPWPRHSFIRSGFCSYLHIMTRIILNSNICVSAPCAVIRQLSLMVKSSLHGGIFFSFLLLKEIVFRKVLPIVFPCSIKEKNAISWHICVGG